MSLSATISTGPPKALAPGGGETRWFLANLATVKLTGEETGGQFSLVEMVGAKGDMPPLHVHHTDDETFMIVEGEVTLYVGGETLRGGPGSILFAPREVPHTYRIESETARMNVISSPPAFPEFVLATSVPAEQPTLPPGPPSVDPERLSEVAARYGIEIIAPPGVLPEG